MFNMYIHIHEDGNNTKSIHLLAHTSSVPPALESNGGRIAFPKVPGLPSGLILLPFLPPTYICTVSIDMNNIQ